MDFGGRLDLVERLGRLKDEGALTDQEFASAKATVLAGGGSGASASKEHGQAESTYASWGSQSTSVSKWIGGIVAVLIAAGIVSYLTLVPSSSTAGTDVMNAQQQEPTEAARQQAAPPTSAGRDMATAQADAALNSAEAAVDAAANDIASASTDATTASAQTAEQIASEPVAAHTVLVTKAARCKIQSPGIDEFTSPCTFKKFSATEFEVTTPQFAYSFQVVQQADGHHGLIVTPDGRRIDLGVLAQTGACWNNSQAKICAWAV